MKKEVVIVTGASSGIGFASVIALAAAGYEVVAGVRTDAAMQAWAGKPHITPCYIDVTSKESLEQASAQIEPLLAAAPAVHLINNAGQVVAGPVEAVPISQWRAQFEVNVFGVVAATQQFLPHIRRTRGRIFQISSVSGLMAVPCLGPYAASKFALEALSDSLRRELRPFGVAVVLIEPGPVQTPIWEKSFSQKESILSALRPKSRSIYENYLSAFLTSAERSAREAVPVSYATYALLAALRAKRPQPRYIVGNWKTRLQVRLLSHLPATWVDGILAKEMQRS